MRTTFAGFEPITQGYHYALDGGPVPTPNLHVELVHWDDFETRASLVRRARKSGTDLVFLRLEKEGTPDTITTAGLTLSIHCVLALNGRFSERRCLPWAIEGMRIFLVPVEPEFEECFCMGDEGQFIGADRRPTGRAFEEGLLLAAKRIELSVQAHFPGADLHPRDVS